MGVVGAALRGFGKALRAHRIKHGKRGKTITGVKPMSGKTPWWVTAGGKNPEGIAAALEAAKDFIQ